MIGEIEKDRLTGSIGMTKIHIRMILGRRGLV